MTNRPASCGCTPGTPENGWHEIRSEACTREECHRFAEFMELTKTTIRGNHGD